MSVPLPPRLSAPNSTFGQLSLRDQKPEDYSQLSFQLSQLSFRDQKPDDYSQTKAGTGCLDESSMLC